MNLGVIDVVVAVASDANGAVLLGPGDGAFDGPAVLAEAGWRGVASLRACPITGLGSF